MENNVYPSLKIYVPYAKIKDYILKPNSRHSEEFFAVGYDVTDDYRIFKELEAQFDKTKATDFRYTPQSISYNIYMKLGVTIQRSFKTVWREDYLADLPRLITAHRVRKGKE